MGLHDRQAATGVGFFLGDEGGRRFSGRDGAGLSWRWRGAARRVIRRARRRLKMLWGERRGQGTFVAGNNRRSVPQPNDLSRSLATLEPDNTLIAVIEMGQSSWLVAGIVPGIERHPVKKFEPDAEALLRL